MPAGPAASGGRRGKRINRITHVHETQAFRRRGRTGGALVTGAQHGGDAFDRPFHRRPAAACRRSCGPVMQETARFGHIVITSPSRVTSSRSSVRIGLFAWHAAARKLVKSCVPNNVCAAACVAVGRAAPRHARHGKQQTRPRAPVQDPIAIRPPMAREPRVPSVRRRRRMHHDDRMRLHVVVQRVAHLARPEPRRNASKRPDPPRGRRNRSSGDRRGDGARHRSGARRRPPRTSCTEVRESWRCQPTNGPPSYSSSRAHLCQGPRTVPGGIGWPQERGRVHRRPAGQLHAAQVERPRRRRRSEAGRRARCRRARIRRRAGRQDLQDRAVQGGKRPGPGIEGADLPLDRGGVAVQSIRPSSRHQFRRRRWRPRRAAA